MLGGRQEIAGVLGSAGGDGDVNVNVRGSVKGCGEDQGNVHRISEKKDENALGGKSSAYLLRGMCDSSKSNKWRQ